MTLHTAGCLCGAVRLEIAEADLSTHACHCENCRRQNGACSMTMTIPAAQLRIVQGADAVKTYASSDWAERSFCGTCGSSLWFRLKGDDAPDYYLSAGLLDDPKDLKLTQEIYIDRKPAGWGFANETQKLTGAQVEALYAASPEE